MAIGTKDIEKVKEQIWSALSIYKETDITVSNLNKTYKFFLLPDYTCGVDQKNGGILVAEVEDEDEYKYFKTEYERPEKGKVPYLLIVFYKGKLMIKNLLPFYFRKILEKDVRKLNKVFIKKLQKTIKNFSYKTVKSLFDREDLIEEFFQIFEKSRDFLAENLNGLPSEEDKLRFANKFLIEMIVLWFLQKRGFFNGDENYFITKFKEYKSGIIEFNSYYEFLKTFLNAIKKGSSFYYENDERLGKLVIVGAVPLLDLNYSNVEIPDEVFYQEGKTNELIGVELRKLKGDVPILNFLESRDWTEGNIDDYVLGAVYEKLIGMQDRKKRGAYYTPEEITYYICNHTIKPYITDEFNRKFKTNYSTKDEKAIDELISNASKEQIKFLFSFLEQVKILDPACGSSHFLESAINVLVEIYEKLRNRARELGLREGLKIKLVDSKDNLVKKELLSIDNIEKFRFYLKLFVVLPKNIYGVDIDRDAIQVARARIFLSLAKHFRVGMEEKDIVRFSNVYLNLKVGNSLIGYVDINELSKERGNKFLLPPLFREEKRNFFKKIRLPDEMSYIDEVAEQLGIESHFSERLDKFNDFLEKETLNVDDLRESLKLKRDLIRVLLAVLNSERAKRLYEIIREIGNNLSQKLNEKFAVHCSVKLSDLEKIKPFHWIIEFPDVFVDRGVFDIVIGNPPYGAKLSQVERKFYKSFSTNTNTASLFIKRACSLSRFVSFVVPKSLTYSSVWQDDRKLILNGLIECIDVSTAFKNVKLEQVIYILRCDLKTKEYLSAGIVNGSVTNLTRIDKEVPKFIGIILTNIEDKALKIFNHIRQNCKLKLSDVARTFRGKGLQRYLKDEGGLAVISGKNIKRYRIAGQLRFIDEEFLKKGELEKFIQPKLIFQNIIAHIKKPYDHIKISGTFDDKGYITLDTVNNVISMDEKNYPLKFLLGLMNSEFFSWYVYRFVYNKAIRTMHFDNYFFEKILLPDFSKKTVDSIVSLVDSLLLRFSREKYQLIEDLILQAYNIEPDDLLGIGYGKDYENKKAEE